MRNHVQEMKSKIEEQLEESQKTLSETLKNDVNNVAAVRA